MPRPDLDSIGTGYRKIPLLAIGKDVYCDSRLIISKLETLYPGSGLAPSTPVEAGIRKLFESWTVDGGIFFNAVKMMPYWQDGSFLSNKAFVDDRQKLMGRRLTPDSMEAGRPDGAQHLQQAFDLLETTFLADGRDWILGTKEPSLADLDAVWPFKWLMMDPMMKGSLPAQHFNAEKYPKVFSWVERFVSELERKRKQIPRPTALNGNALLDRTLNTTSMPENVGFLDNGPLTLKYGDEVEVFPADYGQMGKSAGSLIGLTTQEVVILNSKGIYLHFPRWNFTISKSAPKSRI